MSLCAPPPFQISKYATACGRHIIAPSLNLLPLAYFRSCRTYGQVASEFRRALYGGAVPASFGEQFLTEVYGSASCKRHKLHQVDVFGTDELLLTT